jgi:hypothetical protein
MRARPVERKDGKIRQISRKTMSDTIAVIEITG